MSIQSAIYDVLSNDPIVGEFPGFPQGQPSQDTPAPFWFQETIGAERPGILSGVCPTKNYQIRISAVCRTEPELRQLMDAIENRLDGYKYGDIRGCQVNDESTNSNPELPTEYSESMTFSVWYARSLVGANS